MLGKTERRLALVIFFTAIFPLGVAVLFAHSLLSRASNVWLRPEIEEELTHGVNLYKEYVHVVKEDMRHQSDAMAQDRNLDLAMQGSDRNKATHRLFELLHEHKTLLSMTLEVNDEPWAKVSREEPLNEAKERTLEVRRPLVVSKGEGDPPVLVTVFAFDRKWEHDLTRAGEVRDVYGQLARDRGRLFAGFFQTFSVLLLFTAVLTVTLGFVLARGVTKRINRLSNAINRVAAGDLSVRVPVTGSDEMTELSRVFNRMLDEMQESRARIDYLQRIGAWREIAQRLAHEIKNPLTPIQLAVEECHSKYAGDNAKYRALLDTTREIVEEEVQTLRRLVTNFSNFARLPQAELAQEDLGDFVRECGGQLRHLEDIAAAEGGELSGGHEANIDLSWQTPEGRLPASIDKQMLRRVVVNLVTNAAQAIRDMKLSRGELGRVRVSAEEDEGGGSRLVVEDSGPGIAEALRERIFEPYFTTKKDGTGLGLAIVAKIVVEHGGTVELGASETLGGAKLVIHLPKPGSRAILEVREVQARLSALPPLRPSRPHGA